MDQQLPTHLVPLHLVFGANLFKSLNLPRFKPDRDEN